MRQGDFEFRNRIDPIQNRILAEADQVARGNEWPGFSLELKAVGRHPESAGIRCTLRSSGKTREVDEPSIKLLEAAEALQSLFCEAGTPFDWVTFEILWDNEKNIHVAQWRYGYP